MWISVSVPFEKHCKANIKTINMFCYSLQHPKFTKITRSAGAHFKKGGKIFPTPYHWKSFNNKLLKDYCRIP